MNINKSKSKSVLFLFLIYFFAAFTVHADTGKRSFFAVTSGPIFMQHSFVALVMPGNVQARLQAAEDEREVGRVGKMILAGMAGNYIGISAGVLLSYSLVSDDGFESITPGAVLPAGVGSVFGSALGVYLAGSTRDAKGDFGSALLGSSLGVLTAFAVTSVVGLGEGGGGLAAILSFAILPPISSAIFFNRSLKHRSTSSGNGLLNLAAGRLGLGVPVFHVRPLFVPGVDAKPAWRFSARVLSVEL
jgi:hypothetical protein